MVNDIATRQRILNLAGFGPLVVDGIRGPKTKAAEKKWNDEQEIIVRDFGMLDDRSEKNVRTLLPEFQRVTRSWFVARAVPVAKSLGLTVKIIGGTRDFAEQQKIYSQGRTSPGPRVTNAKPGTSFHNFGCAFDVGLFDAAGRYIEDDTKYIRFFCRADKPELSKWGGDFKSFKDYPHVEFHGLGGNIAAIRRASE